MALTSEQWKSLEDMAHQIGQETIANGLGSPTAQATGSPSYNENASPHERYNQLWEIRKQQAAEAAESAEQRAERRERVRSNFLTTMNQVQEKQSRTNEASATPAPGSVQAQNLDFLSQYQQENSLLARLKKTGQAAASGIKEAVASNTDAQRALYEAGHSGREAQMQEDLKDLEERLAEARRAYGQLREQVDLGNRDFTERDVQDKADQIKQLEVQISAYKKAPEAQRGATEETSKLADEVKKSAEADIERAKKGRGKLGNFFMDAVAGGAQLLGDIGAGAITGGGAMPSLALRTFGGGTQQARQAGASLGQQIGFGAATATVEMLTEKMADGLAGAFGKGAADDVAEEVIRRLASTPTGQTALRTLYSMGGEGVEEIVSELVSPALKAIYDKGESAKESYGTKEGRKALAADALYSGLLGAALGAPGSAVNIATGRDAKANARNQELTDIYKEIGTPGINQAVKDRGILENIKGGKGYGNLSIGEQANEAMEALRGRTPESVRAGQLAGARNRLFEIQQQRAAEAKAARQNAAPPAQPAAEQEPTTRNPLYESLRPRTEPVAESAATSQTPENAPQTQEAPTGEITPPTAQNAQSEAGAQPRAAETAQARLERAQARYAELESAFDNGEVSEADADDLSREMEQRYSEIQELTPLAERERQSAADAQTQRARVQPAEAASTGSEQNAGTGTDSRGYTGPLVDTQDRVFETNLTEEEKKIPGLTAEEARHIQHHDAEVDARAKARIAAGAEQARADLLAAESWSDEDTATAGYIIQAELEAAEKAGSVEERAAIYKRLAELKKQWNKQGTEQGRALRQRQRFVAEDMVSAAADILYSDKSRKDEKALRKLNPQAKDAIMGKVREYARRFNDMQKNGGTVGNLIQLIKDVSVQRRTTGLFSRENGRAVDFALSEVAKQEGGVDFLKELATTQIKSIASDYLKPGIIDQIKSWRFMAMLSNAATTTANAGSNFVFGSFMEALSGNLALPFDMLMSQVTGQREVAGELGAFSKTKWQGSYDATLRSFLEVTLDAETAQADYGYKELKGGTFKMVGNPLERLLATMQKYQGYALKTTDQAAKSGAEAQVRKGLGKLAEQGKAKAENIDALADQEAKYRTLQSDGAFSKLFQGGRRLIDETPYLHIGNERTGKYGLASDIMPFAQVPANAVAVTLESNPAIGAAKAIVETAKVLADGKNVEPGQQAKAARAWGRVANGAAVAATFAALAAKGYLRDEDDENKDIAAQRKAEGRSGVQLNISALLRGDPSEREDDLWIDFSWIPPLNGLANFGVDMYRAYTEDGHISLKDISLASGEALASAFMDFPAVSKISSMIKTYQYSEAEGILGKALETGVTGAAQTASSILVPNAVRAVAAGLDPYERDVYNTDTYGQGIKNNLIAGIPGLRQTLPERLDTFGQPVKNEGGALHFLDKTVIPGNVSQHNRQSAASKYVEDLIAKTGDKKLQPSRNPPYKATLGDGDDKQSVELTAAERREYQQTRGNAIAEMTQELAESRAMRGTTDGQKALFSAIKSAADHAAEAELAESRGIGQSPTQIGWKDFLSFAEMGAPESVLDRLAENGMTGKGRNMLWEIMRGSGESARAFADTEAQIVGESGTASQARVFEALRGKDYTAEEKQQIWEAYSPSGKSAWKTSYADYAAKNGGDESKATKSSGNVLYDYYAERAKNAK